MGAVDVDDIEVFSWWESTKVDLRVVFDLYYLLLGTEEVDVVIKALLKVGDDGAHVGIGLEADFTVGKCVDARDSCSLVCEDVLEEPAGTAPFPCADFEHVDTWFLRERLEVLPPGTGVPCRVVTRKVQALLEANSLCHRSNGIPNAWWAVGGLLWGVADFFFSYDNMYLNIFVFFDKDMISKIQPLEVLGKLSKEFKAKGKTVVQCHGTFDLMHPGHIKYFEAAKSLGDVLFVTVTADQYVRKGIRRPVFREDLRAQSIAALACVDYVAIDPHETSEEAITTLRPSVYAKGSDYEGKENEKGHPTAREKELVEQCGGRMQFTHDPVTFSSTVLINEHFSPLPESMHAFFGTIRLRYSEDEFVEIFERMRKLRVLVIGDAILDVYHYSNFLGRSVKEEIPRVKVLGSEMFLGGSLAVANTLAGFCDSVGVVAVLGRQDLSREKDHEHFIRAHLKANVQPEFFFRDDAPTIVNERFVNNEPLLLKKTTKVNMRKYFGLYHINEAPVSPSREVQWARRLKEVSPSYDVVVVTDYGLGMLTNKLITTLVEFPQFLAVNTQTNSINYGFNVITKYRRADYVSISQPEMRLALHDKHSDVAHLAARIAKAVQAKTVAVTLGALGVCMWDRSGSTSIPALSTSVVDNIGAGDTFLALSALGAYLRLPNILSGFLGSIASALACGIVANKTTVDHPMVVKAIHAFLKSSRRQDQGAPRRESNVSLKRMMHRLPQRSSVRTAR